MRNFTSPQLVSSSKHLYQEISGLMELRRWIPPQLYQFKQNSCKQKLKISGDFNEFYFQQLCIQNCWRLWCNKLWCSNEITMPLKRKGSFQVSEGSYWKRKRGFYLKKRRRQPKCRWSWKSCTHLAAKEIREKWPGCVTFWQIQKHSIRRLFLLSVRSEFHVSYMFVRRASCF